MRSTRSEPGDLRDDHRARVIALFAAAGDLRVRRAGGIRGAERLKRHVWRMSYSLFVAAGSFFLGQAKVIPEPIRIPGLLALPVLAVLATMFWWLWRLRVRNRVATVSSAGPTPRAFTSVLGGSTEG